MKRRTPLKRTGSLKRTGRLNPISKRRKQRDANYEQAREQVYERCAGVCEVRTPIDTCTWRMTDAHHIAGRVGPDPHRLSNLVGCCRTCHDNIHAHPEWAKKWGWMASRHGGVA